VSGTAAFTPAAKKRGRPPGANSADTRARLIDSARRIFAEQGFDRATIGDIARGAGIGPSAFYRHFLDKESLYEAVFDATVSHVWQLLDESTQGHASAREAITAFVATAERAREGLPHYPEFLGNLAYEAGRNPRLRTLVARRIAMQRPTFRSIAELGRSTGEFDDTIPVPQLGEHLRVIVMGWVVERNLSTEASTDVAGFLHLLRL
jgi:AcrR family transcriptional regulator